jgi:limonene-1,2-epoxide hydrolase
VRVAAVAAALAGFMGAALAQAPGERSAVRDESCDRECLLGFVRGYMDALTHKDPARAHLAPDVRFTENDVEMPVGNDGLWGSITAAASNALEVADPTTGNAAWFGTVEEHGAPAYYAMRLKVVEGRIVEVETVVDRKTGMPAPFGDPDKVVHDPAFSEILPPEQRRPRERLIAVANGYFSTVELNDGAILTEFDPECERNENGVSTTHGSVGAAALVQGCEAQFKLGIYRINKRVRERRYLLVDEERGVVVGTGFFDHANTFDSYKTTDGQVHATALKWPNSLSLMEAFKIRNGKIYRVEAVFTYIPYFMHSPWVAPPPGNDAALPVKHDHATHPGAPCGRDCLIALSDRYMQALVAKDPSHLPWAKVVRYTENSVSLMIGDGIWGSISAKSDTPLHAADPVTGNVSWFGLVEEHGAPAYYAMRLKVEDGKISEIETVIDRKGDAGPFGDPTHYVHDPAFQQAVASGHQESRNKLIETVNGYFSTMELNDGKLRTKFDPDCQRVENGISTTQGNFGAAAFSQGCESQFKLGFYKVDDRLRARRFPLVDPERGIVVATAYIDHAARYDTYQTTDGQTHKTLVKYPNSLGLMETFKIRDGRIYRVEAVFTFLPYFMTSEWVRSPGYSGGASFPSASSRRFNGVYAP